jgi:predicted MPP superfamily phosphohydrolase
LAGSENDCEYSGGYEIHGHIDVTPIKWSLVLLLSLLPAQIWGQAVGAISGTVTDSTGAVISQAKVSANRTSESQQPWFFAVLADPQLGMYANDQNFAQETANFEFAVANLNRLHPRFVVICGDLVNRTGDPAQIVEYERILQKIDPSIPVYNVSGNHDVGDVPTPETLAEFHTAIGRDYYTFSIGNIFGIVLDSSLIGSPAGDPEAARIQEEWLQKTLSNSKSNPKQQIVVFQHIPYFIKDPNESNSYYSIPNPARRRYLDLLEQAGVRYVISGHYHGNAIAADGPLTQIVTGAVGMPFRGSVSGFRIVTVEGRKLDPTWFCFGGIPNQVDPQKPSSTPCQQ